MKKVVANLIAANKIADSNKVLGNNIINSNRELGERLQKISNAEIKSKDRVDISLEEYESMKNKIKTLSYEVDRLNAILGKIKMPLNTEIIPDSIRTYWHDSLNPFRQKCRIEFEVNGIEKRILW